MGLRLRVANQRTAHAGAVAQAQELCRHPCPHYGFIGMDVCAVRVGIGGIVDKADHAITYIGISRIPGKAFFYIVKRLVCRACRRDR